MKKFVSLFLVVVLCLLTVPMQAFALESDLHAEEHTQAEQTRGCSHPEIIVYETNPDGYVSVGSNGHKMQYKHSGICTSCNQTASMYSVGTACRYDRSYGTAETNPKAPVAFGADN